MKVIGLTGGIGSGKTTVATIFKTLGVPVFDSDAASKALLNSDPDVKKKVSELLGPEAYTSAGADRSLIADRVFTNKDLLNDLNNILHPAVQEDMQRWLGSLGTDASYCIKEAAILFESGANAQCDQVIAVWASQELRLDRVQHRDGANREDVRARMKNQWPQERVVESSDFTINNDGQMPLIPQVLDLHDQLK